MGRWQGRGCQNDKKEIMLIVLVKKMHNEFRKIMEFGTSNPFVYKEIMSEKVLAHVEAPVMTIL